MFVYLLALSGQDRAVLFSGEKTFDYKGDQRKYLTSKVNSISPKSKLIIGLHGFTDTPRRFAYYTALHNAIGQNDIVIYPKASKPTQNGTKPGWNSGFCCGSGYLNKVDDSGFIAELTKSLANKYGISDKNIFVAGFSNGAFMAQRVAIDNPGLFSGVFLNSASIGTEENRLHPNNPTPIMFVHGRQDKIVPMQGGPGSSDPDFVWLPFSEMKSSWESANQSTNAPIKEYIYEEDGHKWHGWRIFNFWHKKPEASQKAVQFFESLN